MLHIVDEGYQYWMAVGPEGVPVGPSPDDLLTTAKSQMAEYRKTHLADILAELPRDSNGTYLSIILGSTLDVSLTSKNDK